MQLLLSVLNKAHAPAVLTPQSKGGHQNKHHQVRTLLEYTVVGTEDLTSGAYDRTYRDANNMCRTRSNTAGLKW